MARNRRPGGQDLLAGAAAEIVLTGTSDIDEPGDRALWRAARAAGIASHVVLDQRVNLAQRFIDASGTTTFPDWIYVSDDDYAAALTAIGMPRDGIRVTGDIHLAREARRLAQLAPAAVSDLRATWDGSMRRQIVLFVSECGREMAAAGRPMHCDEIAELEKLLAALENGGHPAIPGTPCGEVCLVVNPIRATRPASMTATSAAARPAWRSSSAPPVTRLRRSRRPT